MRLTVIGCSGSLPGPGGPASCYLVEADGFRLVLDLGSGAIGNLQRHVDPSEVDAVLLSHLHPDHFHDLCGLYVARRYGPVRPARPVAVLGPSGVAERVAAAYGPTSGSAISNELAFTEVRPGRWRLGPYDVTAAPVVHPVEAYAYRLEAGGRVLAYSGDCAPCPGLDEVARGADLALVEAAFTEAPLAGGKKNEPGIHHTGREAGELAARVGADRLVVTHVPPWHDPAAVVAAARAAFDGPVEAARPGASYDV